MINVSKPPKTIGILTKMFRLFGPNLVILAGACDELLRGHAKLIDGHTIIQTQATAIAKDPNWPKIKKMQNDTATLKVHP